MRGRPRAGLSGGDGAMDRADGDVLGQPFFVMDYLDGAAERSQRPLDGSRAGDGLRPPAGSPAPHRLDLGRSTSTVTADDATHARRSSVGIDVYRAETDVAIPLLEEGAAWLQHHAPAARAGRRSCTATPGRATSSTTARRVIAFTDWEFTHLGDPMEDWAYLVTMRGARTMSKGEWLELFERVAGVTVTDRDLHYWSVFNYFKGACANLTCRRVFRTGNPPPTWRSSERRCTRPSSASWPA